MQERPEEWRIDERWFRSLVENASDVITVARADLTILFQTSSGAELLGYSPEELEGTKFSALVDRDGLSRLRATCAEAADGVGHHPVQVKLRHRDGSWLDAETVVRFEQDGGHLVLTTRDVRERKRAERQLQRRAAQQAVVARLGAQALAGAELPELMLRTAAEVANTLGAKSTAILEHVPDRDVFVVVAGVGADAHRRTGTTVPGEGSQPAQCVSDSRAVIVRDWSDEPRFAEASFLQSHGLASGICMPIPGGEAPYGAISVQAGEKNRFSYDDGVFLQVIANILAAAVARFQGEEKIRHQALHDSITGLPNRTLFEDRLTTALAAARRHGRRLAVLFLDLDNFKRVNDSLGHAAGDLLLKAVADQLCRALRAEDTLARFGGDEFAVLLPELETDEAASAAVERIHEAMRLPVTAAGRQILISASVGIAIGGVVRQTDDAQSLVRDADLAMYAAKQRGPGGSEFFAEHMYDTAVQRLDLTADLYAALEHEQLEVHYQPIVALEDEKIVGVEALVRWNHPKHGLLPPAVFIPLAEETGLIVPLGRVVLRAACKSLSHWQRVQPQHRNLRMSVNLSTQELHADDLIKHVKAVLAETGLSPSSLILEITESALLAKDESVMVRLRDLKALGVRLAVDDFGTGYSALSYLQRFPMDIVKIDKAFIDGLGQNSEQDRLVRGIIELAHGLHLETVAEGIERAEQASMLRHLHSELGQGFHFAKPLSRADMEAILAPVPSAEVAVSLAKAASSGAAR